MGDGAGLSVAADFSAGAGLSGVGALEGPIAEGAGRLATGGAGGAMGAGAGVVSDFPSTVGFGAG